jgi:uncharacterized protein (DUF983 family)
MDFSITTATWLWLMIPMPLLIVLSVITYFTEKERVKEYDY